MPKAESAPKPQSLVVEDTFIWKSGDPDVGEVRVPLKFKAKHMYAVLDIAATENDPERSEMLMARYYLTQVWPAEVVAALGEGDVDELMACYNEWQAARSRREGASYPES